MSGALTLTIATIVASAVHIILYVRYAVAFHPKLRTTRFIAGHCLEASVVFGSFYALGMRIADSVAFQDLLIAAGATLLLDIIAYAVARDFFRPLMSPMNAYLPPVCAAATVVLVFLLIGS